MNGYVTSAGAQPYFVYDGDRAADYVCSRMANQMSCQCVDSDHSPMVEWFNSLDRQSRVRVAKIDRAFNGADVDLGLMAGRRASGI